MTILKELKQIEKRLAKAQKKKDWPMINLWTRMKEDMERRFLGVEEIFK